MKARRNLKTIEASLVLMVIGYQNTHSQLMGADLTLNRLRACWSWKHEKLGQGRYNASFTGSSGSRGEENNPDYADDDEKRAMPLAFHENAL